MYVRAYRVDSLEELGISLQEVLEASGPILVSLKVVRNSEMPDYSARSMRESLMAEKDALEREQAARSWRSHHVHKGGLCV